MEAAGQGGGGVWRAVLRESAIVAFFLALGLRATWPLATDFAGQTLASPDPLGDLWTVHWLSSHLLPPGDLFGGNIFAPEPHAVLFSDLSLGTVVLVAPLRLLWPDPVPLYNAAVVLALAFGGWAFSALARHLTGSTGAGLVAGVLAAFGSHQMSHIYHLNLLTTGWLALFLLGLHRLAERPSFRAAALAGVSFALSAQSTGYYAVAAAVLALVFAAFHWRRLQEPRALRAVLGAVIVAVVLTAPYVHAFMALRTRESLRRPLGMSVHMAFHPRGDLSSVGLLYAPVLGSAGERLFPGLLVVVLAPLALVRRRPAAAFYAAAAGVLLVLSLGPGLDVGGHTLPLPYRALFAIPPMNAMRHPYTFAAVAVMLLSVLAALGFSGLSVAGRAWAAPAVVALAVLETLSPPPRLRSLPAGVPPAYALLDSLPAGVILEVPPFAPETLVWAARHGRSVVNGVAAFAPPRTLQLDRFLQNHWFASVPEDIDDSPPTDLMRRELGVRYMILPTGRNHGLKRLVPALARSRVFSLVGVAGDGDRVYELLPP